MERLTYEADFGLEEWEQTLYKVQSDSWGAYNILDIASLKGEKEFDEILKTISLRLKHYEDTGLTPEQIRELKERNTPKEAIYEIYGDQGCGDQPDAWICPNCEAVYDVNDDYDFCPDCGQMILR